MSMESSTLLSKLVHVRPVRSQEMLVLSLLQGRDALSSGCWFDTFDNFEVLGGRASFKSARTVLGEGLVGGFPAAGPVFLAVSLRPRERGRGAEGCLT